MEVLGKFPELNILEPKGVVVNVVNNNQMQKGDSNETISIAGDCSGNLHELDLEKHANISVSPQEEIQPVSVGDSTYEANPTFFTIVITKGESRGTQQPVAKLSKDVEPMEEELPRTDSPKKGYFSRTNSSHSQEQCRVCQQEKEECLIDLGCQCKNDLAKAHQSCIVTWFHRKGSNKCEICQVVAVNVTAPQPEPTRNYWVWRINPSFRPHNRERGCSSPLWLALSILIAGLLFDVLISLTLGVSALPVNIIIVVLVVIGLGTAIRLTVKFFHEWSTRRALQRVETNAALGYHPTL